MSNFNFNKVILGGRLTTDIEQKQTQSGISVCNFTIAVNRKATKDGKQEADFITCQAWRGTAEFLSKYFKKGSAVCVVGQIQTRSWTDANGQKKYATDVIVDEAMFVDGKNDAQGSETFNPTNYIPDAYKTPQTTKNSLVDDDDIPF